MAPHDENTGAAVPAKQAALALGISYKTTLRLISEGVLPAIDLNAGTGGSRPRFMVNVDNARAAIAEQAKLQQQARGPKVPHGNVDIRRILTIKPGGRSR